MAEPPTKEVSLGGCRISKISPPLDQSAVPQTINIYVSLEQALMLGLALDECAREVNSRNRATTAGREAAVLMAVRVAEPDRMRIDVLEGRAAQDLSPYGRDETRRGGDD